MLTSVISKGKVASAAGKAVELIKADAKLVDVVLEKANARQCRERALKMLLGRTTAGATSKTLYIRGDEFWIAKAALANLYGADRSDNNVVSASMRWWRNGTLSLDDRAFIYLSTIGGDYSDSGDQKVLADMLVYVGNRDKVFDKIVKTGDLKEQSILVKMAKGDLSVPEPIALWAVDQLQDEGLVAVAKSPMSSRIGFRSVRNLKSQDAIVKVAQGDFSQVSRIEAINRLNANSSFVLHSIAKSNDANFRQVALDRMKAIGLSIETAKKDADEVTKLEQAKRASDDEKLRQKREADIKAAQHDLELARIDESIVAYRTKLNGGTIAEGDSFQFHGIVRSIVSKKWRPKIRIEVKGAKEKLSVLCNISGKLSQMIEVGNNVTASGKYKTGTIVEVTLSDARLTTVGKDKTR